jgi:cell division transport system ATP-binding protein
VVRFENVGLRYSLGPEVLRDVSFQLAPRSFQFLTGPSGAGKSSLLRMLFLALRPTRGLINLFGHDVAMLSQDALATLRRRIGVVFQDFRLLDHLTTYENVALPLRVIGREEASYRNEVVELLNWVGLGDRMASLPPILSGGEKQRAAIARNGDCAAAAAACRRAHRQCGSQSGAQAAAAPGRAQQVRHLGGDRDP